METAEAKVAELTRAARAAQKTLAQATLDQKNRVLANMAANLRERKEAVLAANRQDLKEAEVKGLKANLRARLVFNEERLEARLKALEEIIALPDPVGKEEGYLSRRGLRVRRVRVPLGVIGVIFEARPHVLVNAGALGIKAGNAVILKGGREVTKTNYVLGEFWRDALKRVGLPPACFQLISGEERELIQALVGTPGSVDLLIPRGGKELIDFVSAHARVPVVKHAAGICHVYVDEEANLEAAVAITRDSKVLMPEVCNALETLLVHEKIAPVFLPEVREVLEKEGVVLKGCPRTRGIIPGILAATAEDWVTEYLDLILAVKVVSSLEEAIHHINFYGSHHTDAIVSNNFQSITTFTREVDTGVVLVNASTMFNDGGELGRGAEMGISTDRLQARGPVGLNELTTYKYLILGQGDVMGR